MIDTTATTATGERVYGQGKWQCLLLAVVVSFPAALWVGCSVEKHHDLLSFFFDGVPDPNAVGAFAGAEDAASGNLGVSSSHKPFAEGRCKDCHESAVEFGITFTGYSDLDASVCSKCHETVLDRYPQHHGPVAAKACLWCHSPHESRFAYLLRSPPPRLCLQCHVLQLQGSPHRSEHATLERNCLECHSGHGGQDRYFLLNQTTTEETGSEMIEPVVEGGS